MTVSRVALVGAVVAATCAAALAASTASASPAHAARPQAGGFLRMGTTNGLVNLNPFVTVSVNGLALLRQMYPYLVQYDAKQQNIVSDFASSWKTSKDGKTWTFRTRSNAKWSDGTPLTAVDAAWTIGIIEKYAKTAAANLAGSLAHLQSVRATSATTLVVKYDLAKPASTVLGGLTRVPILPPKQWKSYATGDGLALQTVPSSVLEVGGGPFTLTDFKASQVALFKRNDRYYGRKPSMDGFGLQVFTSPEVELSALQSGQIDWIQSVPPQALSTLAANKNLSVRLGPSFQQCDISFNSNADKTTNRELLDPKVRQAIAYGINVPNLIKVVMNGAAIAAPSIVPIASKYWRNPAIKMTKFNPSAGNQLLDQLGFTKKNGDGIRIANGHPMSYKVIYSAINPLQQATFNVISTSLRQIGVQLVAAPATGAGFSAALREDDHKAFDTVMDCWTGAPDPDFILNFTTCAYINIFTEHMYCSKQYDALYSKQSTTVDPKKRRQVIFQMQSLLAKDKPWLWLYSANVAEAWSKKWTGFTVGPAGTLTQLTSQALIQIHQS